MESGYGTSTNIDVFAVAIKLYNITITEVCKLAA
jgi:hypothetical protein